MSNIDLFTDYDNYLFKNGTDHFAYKKLGAHICVKDGVQGVSFSVYAPKARRVSVITNKNNWDINSDQCVNNGAGVWEVFIPGMDKYDMYRYAIFGADGILRYKSDPYAFYSELRPANASIVFPLEGFEWTDDDHIQRRAAADPVASPMAIYEVHLGSWKKDYSLNQDGFLNYRRLADELSEYVVYMGYTHVELIGICEHPFDGSWGYQVTGFYAPTSRFGDPDDFRYFVNKMHSCGISVILDWVPAHFPKDYFGLERFDGSNLYESDDPLMQEFPEWGTKAFDHSKPVVRSFLISNAFYWINEFHIDGLRVDAVASMLYVSYGRSNWRPNKDGGLENYGGTDFLRQLNKEISDHTSAYIIAEDSSIMAGITNSVDEGGYGFTFKWNMGWMNETLRYFGKDPVYREYHHDLLTHPADYAFLENYILVLSHDEVVHLKKSMLYKNPGTMQDKFGALKTLYTYQVTFPGKKLLFMGQDFAMDREWDESREIDWGLADNTGNRDVMETLRSLLSIYRGHQVLYADSKNPNTFNWVNQFDAGRNVISYVRRNPWNYSDALLVICNFSPVYVNDYLIGAPENGGYRRIFSTYDNLASEKEKPVVYSELIPCCGLPYSLSYSLRPYESVILEFPKRHWDMT